MRTTVHPRPLAFALALAIALMLAACSPSAPPGSDPSIRGTISSVTGASILIEGAIEADTSYDKASVTITEDTDVFSGDGSRADLAILQEGMRVEAWFTGAVAESYPVQATASAVRVLGE
jgi:hypothetical protein